MERLGKTNIVIIEKGDSVVDTTGRIIPPGMVRVLGFEGLNLVSLQGTDIENNESRWEVEVPEPGLEGFLKLGHKKE